MNWRSARRSVASSSLLFPQLKESLMKPRQPNESDAHYIKRLEDANASLRANEASTKKWMGALNEAVTRLSTDASLAFQAMAEKACVRSHPSVTAVVALFDQIAFPNYRTGEETVPAIKFPTDWDLDSKDAWSGDADMELNAPLAEVRELLHHLHDRLKPAEREALANVMTQIDGLLKTRMNAVKEVAGFVPKHLKPLAPKHYREMSAEELRDLVDAMGWMALDLAQDMHSANHMLRRDLRAAAYRRICADLYTLSQTAIEPRDAQFDVKVVGGEQTIF